MRGPLRVALLTAALGVAMALPAASQETLDPTSVGAGSTVIRQANGQTIEIHVTGTITAMVTFAEVSEARVTGTAYRLTADPTSGTVIIRWVGRDREVALGLNSEVPTRIFGMEGGEGDKRTGGGSQQSQLD